MTGTPDVLRQLLRPRGGMRTADGTWVHACRAGRLFVVLFADGWGRAWLAHAEPALGPVAADLAWLHLCRRDLPSSLAPDTLFAPKACAAELLGVLLAAIAGDLEPARLVAGPIAEACAPVRSARGRARRRQAAVEAMAQVEAAVPLALTDRTIPARSR
jgi:hypothetical protein